MAGRQIPNPGRSRAKPRLRLPCGYQLRFSDDGSLLLCIGRRISLFDLSRGERLWFGRQVRYPSHGSFSPDGARLAIKNTSGRIVVLKTCSGEIINDFRNQKDGEGCGVHFAPTGEELIDGSWRDRITVRDSQSGTARSREVFPGEMIVSISHDIMRHHWLVGHCPRLDPEKPGIPPRKGYVRFRNWPFRPEEDRILRFPYFVQGAALSPGGDLFCFSEISPNPRIYIASTGDGSITAESQPLAHAWPKKETCWSPDGAVIATVQRGKFVFYRSSDLTVAGEVPATYPSSVAFRPGSEELALGTWQKSKIVMLRDIMAGTVRLK